MTISLEWLAEYVGVPPLPELEDALTRSGLSVEAVRRRGADFPNVVVARILESAPHPNADRLSVCKVDDGSGTPRQIVCGAKNYQVGDKVPLALPGAVLPGDFKIKTGKLRGVESEGMMCSAKELELAADAQGLLILPPDAPIGAPISELFPPDTSVELEITPNRPDWLGHIGVARELAAFTGGALRLSELECPPAREENWVRIEDARCPFYSARRISDVNVGPSPGWLARRLEAAGLRPINNIVDITNYVMLETGQPLHAFDASIVSGGIVVRAASAGESLAALDGREYELAGGPLVIADASGPLAIAGIMGGESSGVTARTRSVILESAEFDPAAIRRASRALGLSSDSSYRFERGVDPCGVLAASARAVALILEIAGGTADPHVTVAGRLPQPPQPAPMRFDRCRQILGADLDDREIEEALASLGVFPEAPGLWTIPSHRRDLAREADLAEEVARVVGIDRIPSRMAAIPAPVSSADRAYDFCGRLRSLLAGRGLCEARTSSLVSPVMAAGFDGVLRLRNPMGEDASILRPALYPGLIESLARNLRRGADGAALFETGKVFLAGPREECLHLAVAASGPARPGGWNAPRPEPVSFFDLKGLLSSILPALEFRPASGCERFVLKCEISHAGRPVGFLGQLAPDAARAMDAPGAVLVAEMAIASLIDAGDELPACRPPAEFPASARDIAVVCPLALTCAEIVGEIFAANEPFLEAVDPFDQFSDPSGERLPKESKSLAFSLTFRASDRTLKSEEINAAISRIKERLKGKLPVTFRE